MRLGRISIVAFAMFAWLAMHAVGLHMHIGPDTQQSGLHGAHIHGSIASASHHPHADSGDHHHDHTEETDVAISDIGTLVKELGTAIALAIFVLLPTVWVQTGIRPPYLRRILCRQRIRWRPLLRAPPTAS